jgi:very-short-patch-repair endonuclease
MVISREQAVDEGLPSRAIGRLLSNSDWRQVLPRTYLINQGRLTWKAKLMAAILWAGKGAVVSHRGAAKLHGLRHGEALVEITVPKKMNSAHGVKVHVDPAVAHLPKAHIDGLPVTLIARTIFDLCGVLSFAASTDTALDAVRSDRVDLPGLSRASDAFGKPGKRGTKAFRRILTERLALGVTDSVAEDIFLALANRRGYRFTYHHVVREATIRAELDFADLPGRLDIEIDGGKDHGNPVAQQRDRNRDAELVRRGWAVLRFTYWDLIQRPEWVFECIDDALAGRRPDQLSII